MRTTYEFINFSSDFPIRISLERVTNHEKDWHTLIKIIYVVEGDAKISLNDNTYRLKTDDIILINPWTIYEIETDSELAYISFEINIAKYRLSKLDTDLYFECNSSMDTTNLINFKIIKSCILALIKINTQYKSNLTYINASLAYQILYVLMDQFRVEGYKRDPKESKHFSMLKKIIDYINDNYDKNLSLNEVAMHFGYTPQYFSSFFSKRMNQTFQAYYDSFRINTNLSLLVDSDYPLEEIALKCGFNDYRSYIRAFKNIYKLTPSEYRKNKQESRIDNNNKDMSFDRKHYLDVIYNHKIKSIESMSATIDKNLEIHLDYNKKTKLINRSYLNLCAISKASDLLKENIREIIKKTQNEIGFKYIRFHGIFSDDLHVYRKFVNGEVSYSFVYIDEILDFLKSVNLKPFLELSFMPRDLAKNKDKIVFESKFLISEPDSIDSWLILVNEFYNHIIDRYGLAEVESWPVTIWSQPDSTTHAFGFDDDLDFYKFYHKTYDSIKAISNKILVGSPNLIPFASFAKAWDKDFLDYTLKNGCYPDFLNVSYYANDFNFFITGKKIEKISKDSDNLMTYIDMLKDKKFYLGDKIYLSNWNLTSSQRNYLNDTLFLAAYLVKNILENMDKLESFTKWSLSDFMDETQLPSKTYHGGVGLFTYNGIPKASYEAIRLLSRLKGNLLDKGDSYYITKENNSLQILIYNYEHYCDLYADGEFFTLKDHSRYDPFLMNKFNKFKFHFSNLNYSYAIAKVTRITKESGSSYDIHEEMGELEPNGLNEIDDLKALSRPKYEVKKMPIENNELELEISCNSLEIKLIEINLHK